MSTAGNNKAVSVNPETACFLFKDRLQANSGVTGWPLSAMVNGRLLGL